MWETYVEPTLKAQAELRKQTGTPAVDTIDTFDGPMTVEDKVAYAQAALSGMFGIDPLEVGKAVRKSAGEKPDIEAMTAKLLARGKKE